MNQESADFWRITAALVATGATAKLGEQPITIARLSTRVADELIAAFNERFPTEETE